jgi:hypothetical protein
MGATNLGFSFSHVHYNMSLLLFNFIGDADVIEALSLFVCLVLSTLDQISFSTYLGIIASISFYISFYSWNLTNPLLMCVQAMKQGTIEGFGGFF